MYRLWTNLASSKHTLWYGMVLCGMVLCGVVWYGMVWCGVVWCINPPAPLSLMLPPGLEAFPSLFVVFPRHECPGIVRYE